LADENQEIFCEKVKFFENRGKSETGGNASWSQGGWTPLFSAKSGHNINISMYMYTTNPDA